MPATVICNGCGKKLTIRDEHIGRRMKCPQCSEKFVAEEADETEDPAQSFADKCFTQWPALAGAGLIVIGLWIVISTYRLPAGGWISKFGMGLIGLGIASIGYWGLSSSNDDYNF